MNVEDKVARRHERKDFNTIKSFVFKRTAKSDYVIVETLTRH